MISVTVDNGKPIDLKASGTAVELIWDLVRITAAVFNSMNFQNGFEPEAGYAVLIEAFEKLEKGELLTDFFCIDRNALRKEEL